MVFGKKSISIQTFYRWGSPVACGYLRVSRLLKVGKQVYMLLMKDSICSKAAPTAEESFLYLQADR